VEEMRRRQRLTPEDKRIINLHDGERHIERYSFLERFAHFAHLLSLFVLLFTGFKIYLGWDFMSYHLALYIHMIFAIVFILANWVLIPYNIATTEVPHCEKCKSGEHNEFIHSAMNIAGRYLLGPQDFKNMYHIMLNFIGKGDYPAFTVYDVKNKGYIGKLHPVTKFLLVFEGMAVAVIVFTGIVIYNINWGFFGIPVSPILLAIGDFVAPLFGMGTIFFMRTLHLAMAYFFIIEVIIHVGIIEMDPKVWKYHKAIFIGGHEDICDHSYVKLINTETEAEA
jgi:cytochrome b subunit of formate dehydrogenase